MSKKNRKRSRKMPKFIGFLFFAAVIGVAAFFYLQTFAEKNQEASSNQPTEISQNAPDSKTETTDSQEQVEQSDIKKENGIEVFPDSDPNNSATITGFITRAAKTSKGTFRIVAETSQALSEGTCDLEMTNSQESLTASSGIVAHPNAATCTFDFDPASIANGSWNIKVKVSTTENRTGIIEETIEVSE